MILLDQGMGKSTNYQEKKQKTKKHQHFILLDVEWRDVANKFDKHLSSYYVPGSMLSNLHAQSYSIFINNPVIYISTLPCIVLQFLFSFIEIQ